MDLMVLQIQYCIDGTVDVKSKWVVYVAPNHLTLEELGYFKTWCTLQVCAISEAYQLVNYVLKQPFYVLKKYGFQVIKDVQHMRPT